MNNEIWRPIPGYEGLYEASSIGRIKRILRNSKSTPNDGILSQSITTDGRPYCSLSRENVVTQKRICRLVAAAFIPNPEDKPEVNHIDGNKRNNRINNLEWATRSENELHSRRVLFNSIGEKHWKSKLREKDIPKIMSMRKEGFTYDQIAAAFNCARGTVWCVMVGKRWSHTSGIPRYIPPAARADAARLQEGGA